MSLSNDPRIQEQGIFLQFGVQMGEDLQAQLTNWISLFDWVGQGATAEDFFSTICSALYLVTGHTLAVLLADPVHHIDDVNRFLTMFTAQLREQVHARLDALAAYQRAQQGEARHG